MILGFIGEIAVIATLFDYIVVFKTACLLIVGMSVAHFYSMEVDIKLVLQVRPWALLCFPLAFAAIGYSFVHE